LEAAEQPARGAERQRGELYSALTRELIALHKHYYGRGATRARAVFAHRNLLLVEMEDLFLPLEQTMVEKGQDEVVHFVRRTFKGAMRQEFIEKVEELTGRKVENYESVTFTEPDRVLEIFYLEAEGSRGRREPAPMVDESQDGNSPGFNENE
jgi:uncharacterized protein YbcI